MYTVETWPRCPESSAFFIRQMNAFAAANPAIEAMAARFLKGAGVLLLNLVDHWALPYSVGLVGDLIACGLVERTTEDGDSYWEHPGARLPRVRLEKGSEHPRLALAVEDLAHFVEANGLPAVGQHGDPDSGYEEARYSLPQGILAVIVRQGYDGFRPGALSASDVRLLARARAAFRNRPREGDDAEILRQTQALAERVIEEIGRDRAARWQYAQQQQLGFGWANHDHHTYRCARTHFRALMQSWRTFGFQARERFYAGAEAGWGAQILEHPVSRVVIFADLDMAPEELDIDFTAVALPPRDTLGTIGLWCALHGDSIGRAGMHHLECEYHWEQVKANLKAAGIGVMAPFTDLPVLKQAFTEAEIWPVAPERIEALKARGALTSEQAERFLQQGAAGSHLEILQRWEGFKGFNKTGVSAIIRETDARRDR
jgi:hypothetical protein